jgi:3-hydroxybutyryl-CoA dehydratase
MERRRERYQQAFQLIDTGQRYTWRRTFTEADLALFCGVTGDFNPHHLDDSFAADTRFGRRILPGLLPASMVTHIGGMLGFLAAEMHFEFLSGVYVGDTITCTVTIVDRDPERMRMEGEASYVNQEGREVLRARFSGLPTQVRLR